MTKPPQLPHSLLPDKPSTTSRQLLLLPRECTNFASVIQICIITLSAGSKNSLGREKKNLEFGMLNVELSAKPMLNCPILNWEFRIQEATTELKTQNSKCA